jgi:hypothetical protein
LELHREEIEAAGLRIVAVGIGRPEHARRFGGRLAPGVDCVTHEEPELHATFGIEQGNLLRLVAPDAIAAGAQAATRGHTQGTATGDTRRLTATFIVDAAGIVRYAYYGKHAGDHPDLPTVVRRWREINQGESA